MHASMRVACCIGVSVLLTCCLASGPYKWLGRDAFDEIMEKMGAVNEDNCKSMSEESLRLPLNAIGQIPRFNRLPQIVIFPNRTNLIYLHNIALNRAYFYSYILQRLNTSEDKDFPLLPGMLYYYLGAAADVSSGVGLLNGSGVYFDTNCQYANWYPSILPFNETLPLFAPRAFLLDDYSDPVNWLREPTNHTIRIDDLGSGFNRNYTQPWHPIYPNVINDADMNIGFIPDRGGNRERKHQYDFTIYNATSIGKMNTLPIVKRKFFGPPSPGTSENYQPAYFSRPYFDCGHSNKWIVSSVAPVIDFMMRYSDQTNLRKPQYVATTVTDLDFLRIDFDPCGRQPGSQDHTYFSGVARCRSTTLCEPLSGFGFSRGGYMCHCRPGYRYPYWQNGPFMGVEIEQASESEAARFECIPVRWKMQRLTEQGITPGLKKRRRRKRSVDEIRELVWLMQVYNVSSIAELRRQVQLHDERDREMAAVRKSSMFKAKQWLLSNVHAGARSALRLLSRMSTAVSSSSSTTSSAFTSSLSRKKRAISTNADYGDENIFYLGRLGSFDPHRYNLAKQMFDRKLAVTADNCAAQPADRLLLPGEAGHGAEVTFEAQARTALRLAHFLSAFSQNVDPDEMYGALRSDGYLNQDQLYGEVFANVMSDQWILSSGVYFDREAFWDPLSKRRLEFFGPTAFKLASKEQTEQKQRQLSFEAEDAAGWPTKRAYHSRDWFRVLKERWASNTYGLESFVNNPHVRSNVNGTGTTPFQRYPMFYRAPRYSDLYWTQPYFDCNSDRDPQARHLEAWAITVAVPFFGVSEQKTLQFLGVVTVTVSLDKLDINQCPGSFYMSNYFKNTAPCHYETTYCVPVIRNQFALNNFKCECRQGYEYAFNDISIWFFAGGTVSTNYDRRMRNERNYYRLLQCREASAHNLLSNWLVVLAAAAVAAASAAAAGTSETGFQ